MDNIPWAVSYFWHRVLCNLEEKLGGVFVSCWFDQTEVFLRENNQLVLKERSAFRREQISRRALPYIQDAAKEEFNLDIEVVICEE